MESFRLTPKEQRRLYRQLEMPRIGLSGLERLKQSSVIVFGTGGLGCCVAQGLAASGTGRITLVDDGLVDEKSLMIQSLYGVKDLGKHKTIAARARLKIFNPVSVYEVLNLKINPGNILDTLAGKDLVIDTSPEPGMHFLISDACILTGKPHVIGLVHGSSCSFGVFNLENGPSFRCFCPGESVFKKKYRPSHPAYYPAYSITASLMVHEVVGLLAGSEYTGGGTVCEINIDSLSVRRTPVQRNGNNFLIKTIAPG